MDLITDRNNSKNITYFSIYIYIYFISFSISIYILTYFTSFIINIHVKWWKHISLNPPRALQSDTTIKSSHKHISLSLQFSRTNLCSLAVPSSLIFSFPFSLSLSHTFAHTDRDMCIVLSFLHSHTDLMRSYSSINSSLAFLMDFL